MIRYGMFFGRCFVTTREEHHFQDELLIEMPCDGKVVTWNAEKRRMETTSIPAAVDATPTEGSSNLITSGAVYSAIVQTLNTEV